MAGRPFTFSMSGESQTTIFVTNISYKSEGQAVGKEFERFGPLAAVRIITYTGYRGDQLSRGFGFVEFKTAEGYQRALDFSGQITVDGRTLSIRAARPRQARRRDTAFVAGVVEGTTSDQIKAVFAKYHPKDVRIVRTAPAGSFGGFAFVTFDTEEDQAAAVTENRNITINGVNSVVRFARPRGSFQRGGFRGGGGGGGFRRGPPGGGGGGPRRAPRSNRPPPGDGPASGSGGGGGGAAPATDRPRRAERRRPPRGGRAGGAPADDSK